MSTLTSASTLDEIKAAYIDNASYEEDASVAKCKAFITACRILLLKLPTRSATGGRTGQEFEFDIAQIKEELAAAQQWNATTGASLDAAGGGHRTVDFRDFRT